MAGKNLSKEYAVIRSFKNFREKYLRTARKNVNDRRESCGLDEDISTKGSLDSLPVDMQYCVMSYLSPVDLCRLGGASRYWRAMVRDPLLWRYFLLRDMPHWRSIDHTSMPHLEALDMPLPEGSELPGRDFMADYLKGCLSCRGRGQAQKPAYGGVASFLHSLVVSSEPRFAMFGPGLEQLEVSLMTQLMYASHLLPTTGTPQRQINGIGSGISFIHNNQEKFNILTLYSTNKAERERVRVQHQSVVSKLFVLEDEGWPGGSGGLRYRLALHVQEACQVVDGFIFVANAEPERGAERDEEDWAQIRAMVDPAWGVSSRPILVLSCVSREEVDRTRTPCVIMAQRLNLRLLPNPWRVQDTVAESLTGLLDGIGWLLDCSGLRL